ncbi:hypothetical protein OROHE_019414 [Orobanche hederae]
MDSIPTSPQSTPPSLKQNKLSPLYQYVLPKQSKNHHNSTPDSLLYTSKLRSREQPILRQPQKTKPIVWCAAILCMIFIILVIFLGVATLIVFLEVEPRKPTFDTPAASLGSVYFNPPGFINGDITFLANISNPNRRLGVRFEYLRVGLYFSESLVATQVLEPFCERPGQGRLVSVHLLSRFVYLPPDLTLELQKQHQMSRVVYNIKGALKVKIKLGVVRYSYWLHGKCRLEMTSPPNSTLITHNCTTTR